MRALFYIIQVTVLLPAYASALTDTTTDSPMVTTSDGSYCQGPWNPYKRRCYLRVTEQLDFSMANTSCPANGQLVSISDEDENNFVKNLSGSTPTAWIGLYRQRDICANHSLCGWMWIDGSEVEYDKWPNDGAPGFPKCANIDHTGTWGNFQFCHSRQDFICERSVWFLTTTSVVTTKMATEGEPDRTVNAVESNDDYDDDDDMPIIIGCVVGGLVLVAIITVVAIVLIKRHRTSRPIDQPVEVTDEDTPKVDKPVRYNPAYEDVETNVTFKPSPGNTDTGAHGVGDNQHNIYSEAIKKADRQGSGGMLVKDNTLYGYGK